MLRDPEWNDKSLHAEIRSGTMNIKVYSVKTLHDEIRSGTMNVKAHSQTTKWQHGCWAIAHHNKRQRRIRTHALSESIARPTLHIHPNRNLHLRPPSRRQPSTRIATNWRHRKTPITQTQRARSQRQARSSTRPFATPAARTSRPIAQHGPRCDFVRLNRLIHMWPFSGGHLRLVDSCPLP